MLTTSEEKWLRIMTSTGAILPVEALHGFFEESLSRWEQYKGARHPNWSTVLGWIRIASEFEMPEDAKAILATGPLERRLEVARAYLAWSRHDSTQGHANPYEPLLSFFHHGGTWTRPENGILDIYDASGGKCGVIIQRARP
ncbi:hypothetical protein GTP41_23865 [Pseudoduganella sp. DS3]|uniref:Uncharacterized protein n=1 Tax=Pseudoduganella guangdongensis TaxID=2692179 RepID=A0A6N9HN92_9BURK|nr:hypothetical protein [Pseudoduganella guangdongensis]MYN05138.1 hypothetical protein [Pseudoduganella guangdongensis]